MKDFKESSKKVDEDDLKRAESKLNEDTKANGFSIEAFNILKDFLSMSWDYIKGNYSLPTASFLAISFSILYFISPVDAIPDFILILGYTDDAAVVMAVYSFVKQDVENYRLWKKEKAA